MLKQCLENIGEGLLHACISSIGNRMALSAIWIKHAQVTFSKSIKIEQRRVLFEAFEKLTMQCLVYPNFMRNHPIAD
jgi:hypothetical protein